MPYLPKHQPQLGRGVAVPGRTKGSRDCGPRTVQMGIDFQSKGAKKPTIPTIRQKMGRPGPQQTNIYNTKQAVDGMPVPGRKPLRYFIKSRTSDVEAAVRAGKYVQLCLDYGMFNRLMNKKTGDPNFTGGHSVGVVGQRKKNGVVQWLLFDPLDDQRRRGIPKGPRWVPKWKLLRALESFAGGRGRCYAGVFGGGEKR